MMRVCENLEAMHDAAARLFVETATAAVERSGRFAVALSGGHTPAPVYRLLAAPPWSPKAPWARAHVFWSDERCIPESDPRSNAGQAHRALLDHVPIPARQVHAVPTDIPPEAAAERYQSELRAFFAGGPPRFDLILLGLGEDGHTASLFPGSPALGERERWVCAVNDDAHELPRVTFTPPLLSAADRVVFLVGGAGKREILARVRGGEDLPAVRVRPESGQLLWLVDRAAAPGG